jgi:hypothetical protein
VDERPVDSWSPSSRSRATGDEKVADREPDARPETEINFCKNEFSCLFFPSELDSFKKAE